MSKTVKQMVMRDYKSAVGDTADAMVISIRGMNAIQTTKVRNTLRQKKIKVQVVRNSLARKSFEGSPLSALAPLLEGPSALAFGGSSVVEVAREVVALLEKFPTLELKGAILDGTLFKGKDGVKELSSFPTREEAIGRVVTLVISPASKLAGQILGPGRKIGGLVKAIEEKLEKGETIAKKAG